MGLSTDAINRIGMEADKARPSSIRCQSPTRLLTCSARWLGIVIAVFGPNCSASISLRACKDYEEKQGGTKEMGGPARVGTAGNSALFA